MDMNYLLWLQNMRLSASPAIQAFWSALGSEVAFAVGIVIPCVLYWCFDRDAGQFALLAYGSSSVFNQLVKNTACIYRPWVRDVRITPDPKAIPAAGGYSFPSGHTQSSASMMGGLGWWYRDRRWPLVLALLFTFLVGFSRNVLGVHTPQDVLVGFAVGCAFVLLTEKLLAWVNEAQGRDLQLLLVSIVLTVIYLVFVTLKPYPMDYVDGELLVDPIEMLESCYKAAGVYLGIVGGWFVERRYVQFSTGRLGAPLIILRMVLGVIIMVVAYLPVGHALTAAMGEFAGELVRHTLAFFLAVAGIPMVFVVMDKRLAARKEQ